MELDKKEVAQWLKDDVETLKANQDYVGAWHLLDNGLALTVLWEPGWGDEKRDDVIQAEDNLDYGLCAGIMIYNKFDTPDGWNSPFDAETGEIICETTGILPEEDYEHLAEVMIEDYNRIKDADISNDGAVKMPKEEVKIEKEVEVEESCKTELKEEENLKPLQKSSYKDLIGEHFNHTWDFEFLDIVASTLDRIDFDDVEDDLDEKVWRACDDAMIYTADQWTVLEFYANSPQEANWEDAYLDFESDIMAIAEKIAEQKQPEEEVEVEETEEEE